MRWGSMRLASFSSSSAWSHVSWGGAGSAGVPRQFHVPSTRSRVARPRWCSPVSLRKSPSSFKSIINNAGEDFQLDARNFDENLYYIYACIIIIKQYYKYPIDFSRPLYYDIPDEDGLMRHYRIAMNADFIDIEPTDRSIDISKDDIELLIQNYNDIDLWKSKFPPKSWILKGFTIVNLTDVTIDDEISNLKTTLLSRENNSDEEMQRFQSIFRSIFGLRDLRAGFTAFNKTDETLSYLEGKSARSYILDSKSNQDCGTVLCESSYKNLVEDKSYFTIVDVDKYAEATDHNLLSKNLLKNI